MEKLTWDITFHGYKSAIPWFTGALKNSRDLIQHEIVSKGVNWGLSDCTQNSFFTELFMVFRLHSSSENVLTNLQVHGILANSCQFVLLELKGCCGTNYDQHSSHISS